MSHVLTYHSVLSGFFWMSHAAYVVANFWGHFYEKGFYQQFGVIKESFSASYSNTRAMVRISWV